MPLSVSSKNKRGKNDRQTIIYNCICINKRESKVYFIVFLLVFPFFMISFKD